MIKFSIRNRFLYFFAFVAADRLWGNWNIRFDWLLCKSFLLFFCSIQFEKRNLPLRQAWGLSGQRPRNKNNQHRIKYHPNPVGGAFDWARTRVVPVRVCSPVRPNCIVHRTVLTLAMDAFWDFLLLWLLAACYILALRRSPRGESVQKVVPGISHQAKLTPTVR